MNWDDDVEQVADAEDLTLREVWCAVVMQAEAVSRVRRELLLRASMPQTAELENE